MTSPSATIGTDRGPGTRSSIARVLRTRATVVWLVLIAATVLQLVFGTDHVVHRPAVVAVLVLFVAFFKVRLVGLWFMELRRAPVALRLGFEGYCAVMVLATAGMYLLA